MLSLSSAWQQEGVAQGVGPPNPPLVLILLEMGPEIPNALTLQAHTAACSVSGFQGALERKRLHQSLE